MNVEKAACEIEIEIGTWIEMMKERPSSSRFELMPLLSTLELVWTSASGTGQGISEKEVSTDVRLLSAGAQRVLTFSIGQRAPFPGLRGQSNRRAYDSGVVVNVSPFAGVSGHWTLHHGAQAGWDCASVCPRLSRRMSNLGVPCWG